MIIKSHVRGGYRSAAEYLKDQGQNEKTRLVEISDPSAKNLNEAFHNMWIVASNTKCTKPLHHISINPMKGERLTDEQVLKIVERCEEKYGYKLFHHQRVIVEHIKDGRQHFHVMWNRVSLYTGRPVWPGEHWKKSKQTCREMEKELGLKQFTPKRMKWSYRAAKAYSSRAKRSVIARNRYSSLKTNHLSKPRLKFATATRPFVFQSSQSQKQQTSFYPVLRGRKRRKSDENAMPLLPLRHPDQDKAELLAWAWENGRIDILAQYGIYLPADFFEP